ncbi:MAG: hypothetical protein Ct9H300mP19_12710 [Dehalococcoidia bacterium]|nr:MAG: hypothetical protein Ct9H300mP19_12710 [Dehalococcoidia bacterium]
MPTRLGWRRIGGCVDKRWLQVNSAEFNGMPAKMEKNPSPIKLNEKWGARTVTYHLRDWLISRSVIGVPDPNYYCDDCGAKPVPEQDLPVLLPENVKFSSDGKSPLTEHAEFLNTTCPECGKAAKRETDTLDTFVCSSWYHLRFPSPNADEHPIDSEKISCMDAC